MPKSSEEKRLEAQRADHDAIADEAEKSENESTRQEGERQRQYSQGISDELKSSKEDKDNEDDE